MPCARCTRSPLCKVESTGVEATGTPESPGIPARNGFNGLCRALPGDRALLPPSSRGLRFCHCPVGPTKLRELDASVGASGPHDFSVRKLSTLVLSAACVHRIQPRVRDDRDTPLEWGGRLRI